MNIKQALEVLNPDHKRPQLREQREAYKTLKQGIEEMQRDLDLATGNYTISIGSTDAGSNEDIQLDSDGNLNFG